MSGADIGDQPAVADHADDPFALRATVHGLPSDEVRSALHKHVRMGRIEPAVRAALELARTDGAHEEMMWQRLCVIAAGDVGLADPNAICVVVALRDSGAGFPPGSYERLELAAQAAGFLAQSPKDPTIGEVLQVVLHDDQPPDIPPEAIDVHTRRGQRAGRTMADWFATGTAVHPEVAGRDRTWRARLEGLYRPAGDP